MRKQELPKFIEENTEDICFLGFARTQGEYWTLVSMTEDEVDKCLEEYKTTGKIAMKLAYAQSTEVIEPIAASKLKGNRVYFKRQVE